MSTFDASIYFAGRAPRYQEALRVCPEARVLDYLPYFAAFAAGGVNRLDNRLACDAFGGTGFLARAFAKLGIRLVVADVCPEMLAGAAGIADVETHVSRDDFLSVMSTYGEGAFDFVFTHGGLHHVVEGSGGIPHASMSRARQSAIVERLARLLKPKGILIVADIPDKAPKERPGLLSRQHFDLQVINQGSSTITQHLTNVLGLHSESHWTLECIRERVATHFWNTVDFDVPRRFFDEFIAPYAPMGHVAVYPDFDDLQATLSKYGLRLLGSINYRGPWLFSTVSEAGWFFREKFSIYKPAPLGEDSASELSVYGVLEQYLGTRIAPPYTAVNWGVTYAAYQAA